MAKKLAGVDGSMVGASAQNRVAATAASELTDDRVAGQPGANLTFRVSPEFRRRFRTFAAERDMKQNELLQAAFEALLRETRST